MKDNASQFALISAAAGWGLTTTGIKYALGGFPPLTLLLIELFSAAAVLWTVLLLRGYRRPPSWRVAIALGLLEPTLAGLADTFGLTKTSAANACVIYGLECVFVIIGARIFLHEQATRLIAVAAAIAVLGVIALDAGTGAGGSRLGDLLVVGGSVSTAAYTVVARRVSTVADALTITAHQFAIGFVVVLPVVVTGWATGRERLPATVSPAHWIVAIAVGAVGFGLSYLLYNVAIVSITAANAGLIVNLTPAVGLVGAFLLLGESLSVTQLCGAVLVALSVGMVVRPSEQSRLRFHPRRVAGRGLQSPSPPSCDAGQNRLVTLGETDPLTRFTGFSG